MKTKFGKIHKGANAGFTIVELLTVIVVMAALLAIAAPNFETLVYGSEINRAVDEVAAHLNLARMKAMRTKRPVTVAFNQPAQNQYTITWTGANGIQSEVNDIGFAGRVGFENNPPGGSATPDASFVFNSLGFVQPSSGGIIGNIYLSDQKNGKAFLIATTPAGCIEKRRWGNSGWDGTPLTYTP
jgi:prepilin-type N-terminal cleavage/methylation domain-containing protein